MVNYYTKNQVDSLIYSINLVGYDTKAEIGTLLYTNYPSLSFIAGNCYDRTYLDNQFSLNADVSQLTEFVATGYLHTNYTKCGTINILL